MTESVQRVAIVTGGSGGIGRATAARLGGAGLGVVVHYSGNADRAQDAVDAIISAGGRAISVRADIAEETDVEALFESAEQEFGGIDVVVHTAGVMPLAPVAEMELAEFDRLMRTNVRGTFVVAQQAAKRLKSGGSIVLFSSSVTRLQQPNYAAYAASKGAVEAMTLILARELRGRDITVNTIAPGPTATPLFLDGKPQEVIDQLASMSPLERLGQPDDIADTVASVIDAHWVNGQILYTNGGIA
ncbi:SDR family oxidoreductase [Microbacterium enclense]|uniref:SDR family oxidoreductase n=1 Tax=Microbacterium enclense TaxID=993073 RepID=A0A443J6L2_9MICO|nr:SDR family oxidoreductase [Microbacterium enclense]RWR16204.1 SDR family oxidoreductase [Microbacterium enclense]